MTVSKKYAILVAGFLFVMVLAQVLYDPISSIQHSLLLHKVRREYPQARGKWDALKITDYTFEIHGNTPSICQPSAIIKVEHDTVVEVKTIHNNLASTLSPDRWADSGWGDEVFLCNYAHFTMPRIFDLLERSLQNQPFTVIRAEFDPQYGFITNLRYGLYVDEGLLLPQIGDCCSDLWVEKFQPLND